MAQYDNRYIRNAGRLGSQNDSIVGNLIDGTQYGFSAHLEMLDANTPLVLPPMRPVVTHTPDMFKYVPKFPEFCKAFFEQHAHTIDNIDVQYSNEGVSMLALADGQTPTAPGDTKRASITPSVTAQEGIGNVLWNFHHIWFLMQKDPDTSGASLAGFVPPTEPLPPHVFSTWSADLLCMQYDTTFRTENMIAAYFATALRPTEGPPAHFIHEHGTSRMPDRQFTYAATLQHNYNTCAIGRQVGAILGMHIPNADMSKPVATKMDDQLANEGIQKEIAQAQSSWNPIS